MKKKSTLIILITAAVIAAVAVYLFTKGSDDSTFKGGSSDFAVTDTQNVTGIFMADRKGNEVMLERDENGSWKVNDAFKAHPDGIRVLMNTLHQLKIYAPVSKSKYETVLKKVASSGIKVEIYKGKDSPAKTFYVGPSNMDHTGNYMLLDGHEKPWVMHIEGFHGYLTPRFIVRENDWKIKNIWNYAFGEIDEIEVEHPQEPQKGFTIKKKEPGVFDVYDYRDQKLPRYDTSEVLGYIAAYKEINFESFEEKRSKAYQDTIVRQNPVNIYTVTDNDGVERKVTTFPKPMDGKTDPETGEPIEFDLDRKYALMDDSLFIVVQNYVFDPLTAEINEFRVRGDQNTSTANR